MTFAAAMSNLNGKLWRSVFVVACICMCGCSRVDLETHQAKVPLSKIEIAKVDGKPSEIVVFVDSNTPLSTIIDTSIFDGIPARTTVEDAQKMFGKAQIIRPLSEVNSSVPLHVYMVPKGEIGFASITSPQETQHQVWAFPRDGSVDRIIINDSAREQLLALLKSDTPVRVRLLRSVGWGGPTLGMTTNNVSYILLGLRDGDG